MNAAEIAATVLMGIGLVFQLVAAVGLVRFPDVYCRLHVIGVNDTLGSPLVLLGLAIHASLSLASLKIVVAIVFLYVTGPLVSHLLARAALESNIPCWEPDEDRER